MRGVINRLRRRARLLYLALPLLSCGAAGCNDDPVGATVKTTEMVRIPAGTYNSFTDSSKAVAIKPFLLDKKAVTNQEFLEFVKANPRWAKSKISDLYADDGYLKHWPNDDSFPPELKNSPVTNVSWYAAKAFSKWKGKRLPTMAEWEYVGKGKIVNEEKPVDKVILTWYSSPTPKVLPSVYSTYQNAFNVYDMHGLVWEWVSDFNGVIVEGDSRSNSPTDREFFCDSGSYSAIDEENYAAFMRFAFRGSLKAKYTVNNLGFRCAADIK